MDADLYPPDIVTLCPSRVSRNMSEETHSPLSSAPNSPRSGTMLGRRSVDEDDDNDPNESNAELLMPPPTKRISDAPFDEHAPDDEKKTDGGDELMGKYNSTRSRRTIGIDDDDNADSGKPPSLTFHNESSRTDNQNDPHSSKLAQKPSMIRQRAMTTGDIRPAIMEDLKQKYLTLSPNGQPYGVSSASQHIRKPSTDMQQHLKFAALKRDIVSINEQTVAGPATTPNTAAVKSMYPERYAVAVTPVQQVKSPPQVVKKQMWSSDPTGSARNQYPHQHLVSPSPHSTDAAWPSFYDSSFQEEDHEDNVQHVLSLKPKTNFSMVSPEPSNHHRRSSYASYESGDIPLPTNSKSSLRSTDDSDTSNAYNDHKLANYPKVYSEDEMTSLVRGPAAQHGDPMMISKTRSYGSQPDDEAAVEDDDDQPEDEKMHPWAPKTTSILASSSMLTPRPYSEDELEQPKQHHFSPFHPQGAVRLARGESEPRDIAEEGHTAKQKTTTATTNSTTYTKYEEPELPDTSDVHSLFASALSEAMSDAVGLAATGVDKLGNLAFGDQGPLHSGRPAHSDAVASVVHPESTDWVDYLKHKGVDSKSNSMNSVGGSSKNSVPSSSSVYANWINNGNTTTSGSTAPSSKTATRQQPPPPPPPDDTYPKMTPKKDFQTSEKSAAWLQEEFRRRSIIKQEINEAILAHGETPTTTLKKTHQFAGDLTKALEELEGVVSEDTGSATDDEVAAITTDQGSLTKSITSTRDSDDGEQGFEMEYYAAKSTTDDKPLPRRLDFQRSIGQNDNTNSQAISRATHSATGGSKVPAARSNDTSLSSRGYEPRVAPSGSAHSMSNHSRSVRDDSVGRINPIGRVAAEHNTSTAPPPRTGGGNPSTTSSILPDDTLNTSLQEEMQRFVSSTRAALRRETSGGPGNTLPDPHVVQGDGDSNLLHSPFRSIAVTSSDAQGDGSNAVNNTDLKITYPVHSATDNPQISSNIPRSMTYRSVSEGGSSNASEFSDIRNVKPALIQSMDTIYGIAKGDVTLSLLNENTGHLQNSPKSTWANRVHGAIWRCRRMRRKMGGFPIRLSEPSGSPQGRSSLPVDMDRARVQGGFRSVVSTQEAALNHLRHDEVDEAIELFEDIIFAYYSYFEKTLKARELNPSSRDANGSTNFKPYIGVALHNLGVLHLLNGNYPEALSFFSRAVENRKICLGEGHRDHVASLSRLAICHYALNEFGEAHSRLEEALDYAGRNCETLEDYVQVAEILNNLGCLAYMCGQPVAANAFFRDSLDVQFRNLSVSLYEPATTSGQSVSLNISISRANAGFVGLVTKELPLAISALENALMEQQILLHGANETLIATMDHLAVANLLYGQQRRAAMMFGRILMVQQNEYGPHDRRCFVTMDKIKMVQSQGQQFELAIEELQKTFSMPQMEKPNESTTPPSANEKKTKGASNKTQGVPSSKGKSQKNKVLKVFNSMRKKR